MLAVSMAVARAAAEALGLPLYRYFRRNLSETSAGTHDEYLKRRKACGEHRGFPGVHDHARRRKTLRKGYGSVRKFIII